MFYYIYLKDTTRQKQMKFYIKFAKLPFTYSVIKTSNSTNALKTAQKYRKDAVVVNPTDKVFTFDEAVNLTWVRVDLENIKERDVYEVYTCIEATGLMVDPDTKEEVRLSEDEILPYAKKRTGKSGVIWAQDNRGCVFGAKKGNFAKPILVFSKVKRLRLK